MGNKIHTVTCPDGSVFTRETTGAARRFNFLIAVEQTQAEIDSNLATARAKLAATEKLIVELEPVAGTAEAQAAHAAAKARRDWLDEEVTETRSRGDGTTYEHTCHRWLSDAYSGLKPDGYRTDRGYNDATAATKALERTAVERLRVARDTLRGLGLRIVELLALTPGAYSEHSWSQTFENASKAANKALQYRAPGAKAHIIPVTDAMVRERQKRAKKTA